MSRLLLASAAVFALFVGSAWSAPKVVVSIKPIHSLVASIMDGVGTPIVLVGGNASPHTYQLKPSQAAELQDADLIFWTGNGLEAFLEKPLASLAGKARIVELDKAEGLTLLKPREGGNFEPHHHDEAEHDHDGAEEVDLHLWLDTDNAKRLAATIESQLSASDPENAPRYKANLDKLDTRLDTLAAAIATTVAPVKDKPFIVFHDAYQYFERQFDVSAAGSITVSPEVAPGAERLSAIRDKIVALKATCVFTEPQFEPKIVNALIDGTSARTGVLDPEAGSLTEGPDLYFDLMTSIAGNMAACLGGK